MVADTSTSKITVSLDSDQHSEYSFSDIAADQTQLPSEHSEFLQDSNSAISSPDAGRAFDSQNPDPNWGLGSSSPQPPPGDVEPYSAPKTNNEPPGGCVLGDP